jgi:hypothetical protein
LIRPRTTTSKYCQLTWMINYLSIMNYIKFGILSNFEIVSFFLLLTLSAVNPLPGGYLKVHWVAAIHKFKKTTRRKSVWLTVALNTHTKNTYCRTVQCCQPAKILAALQ